MKDHDVGKNGNDGRNERNGTYGKNGDTPAGKNSAAHDPHCSQSSHNSCTSSIIPPRGDCRNLLSYQKANVVFQITYRFCRRFLSNDRRAVEQMVPAARSGKQNIVEGSKAGRTSKETEIRLTNVARSSLEELLEDYLDFLSARDLRTWAKDSREARYIRKLAAQSPLTFETFREFTETRSAEVVANIAVCLIHQANFLLDRQLKTLEAEFINEGGLRERMGRERRHRRDQRGKEG